MTELQLAGAFQPGAKISKAFVKAQKAFAPAIKNQSNSHFRNKYADLAACITAVMDALNNNDIALIQMPSHADGGIAMTTRFLHESGEFFDAGTVYVPANKKDAQGYGSAMTYARRYSLCSACGIAAEDDDGNGAVASMGRLEMLKEKFERAGTAEELKTLFLSLSSAEKVQCAPYKDEAKVRLGLATAPQSGGADNG